jgi:2-haloacid dehalogenase
MPMMEKVRKGTLPWMKLDALHRMILDELLVEFHVSALSGGKEKTLGQARSLRPRFITQMRT